MRSNTFETFIGAIVIILAVSFLFYSFSITDNNSEGTYKIKATFNRIDGIQIGSDVRLSGIKIGSVAKSSLNQTTYEADLVLVIDNSIYIPDDSSAKITMDGLLGVIIYQLNQVVVKYILAKMTISYILKVQLI